MTRLAAAVAVLMGLTVLGGVPSTAHAAPTPADGAYFNEPRTDKAKENRVEQQLVTLINKAPKGSQIHMTVFSWDRMGVADAVVRARKRGVRVKILLNNHQWNPAMKRLRKGLGGNRKNRNYMYLCSYGCRSRGENLHTKMFLFSETGGKKMVVGVGSVNFTGNGTMNQFNDLLLQSGNKQLYSTMRNLYDRMARDKPDKPMYWVRKFGRYEVRALPKPKVTKKTDPIMQQLNKVKCKGAAPGYGVNGRTSVRVSMHSWSGERGTYLAEKMRSLHIAGCNVRVMYGWAGASVRQVFARNSPRGHMPVHTNGYDTNYDGEIDLYSHHKYMLISGNYDGSRKSNTVLTGSSNWEPAGLNGDELIFLMHRAKGIRARYQVNFDYIWNNRSHAILYRNEMNQRRSAGGEDEPRWRLVEQLRRPANWEAG